MGVCLSCLRDDARDDEPNESSSLLRNSHMYSNNYMEEAELLKQQQRQQELNSIVNSLSDNLIDISSFLNADNSATIATQVSHSLAPSSTNNSSVSTDKSFPHRYSPAEKEEVLKKVASLSGSVKASCTVAPAEQLYIKFES